MSLKELLAEGRLERTATSKQEIADLLNVALRGLGDAAIQQLSLDGRFNCAYDAALMLSTIPLRCSGYRTKGEGHHYAIFHVLPEEMGPEVRLIAQYLQKCRKIRNLSTYSKSGIVSQGEVTELLSRTEELRSGLMSWLETHHPEYL